MSVSSHPIPIPRSPLPGQGWWLLGFPSLRPKPAPAEVLAPLSPLAQAAAAGAWLHLPASACPQAPESCPAKGPRGPVTGLAGRTLPRPPSPGPTSRFQSLSPAARQRGAEASAEELLEAAAGEGAFQPPAEPPPSPSDAHRRLPGVSPAVLVPAGGSSSILRLQPAAGTGSAPLWASHGGRGRFRSGCTWFSGFPEGAVGISPSSPQREGTGRARVTLGMILPLLRCWHL